MGYQKTADFPVSSTTSTKTNGKPRGNKHLNANITAHTRFATAAAFAPILTLLIHTLPPPGHCRYQRAWSIIQPRPGPGSLSRPYVPLSLSVHIRAFTPLCACRASISELAPFGYSARAIPPPWQGPRALQFRLLLPGQLACKSNPGERPFGSPPGPVHTSPRAPIWPVLPQVRVPSPLHFSAAQLPSAGDPPSPSVSYHL